MESRRNAPSTPEVTAVLDPYTTGAITKDGRIGFADVIYPVPADEIEKSSRDELAAVGRAGAETPACRSSSAAASSTDESEASSESARHDGRASSCWRSRSARCSPPACR